MSLSFLSKKTWHTTNLKNVEKVWLAEQAQAEDAKKLEAWKKDREVCARKPPPTAPTFAY